MKLIIFVFSCITAQTQASFKDATIEQTQQYLKDWNLHEHFGDEVVCLFAIVIHNPTQRMLSQTSLATYRH